MDNEKSLQVVELQAENIMRLKAVRIAPKGEVVILGGKNASGKSSVLACIEMAIAGARAIPDVPVRRGETEGHILLDLGDIRIERTFDPTGTKLIVRNADGVAQKSPQAILDKLYSKVAFNPMEFATQKPAEQLATLKRIVGLDFDALDAKRTKLYDERTNVGRRATDAEARANTYPVECMQATDVEVSISSLVAEKDAADEANRAVDALASEAERMAEAVVIHAVLVEKARKALVDAEHTYEKYVALRDKAAIDAAAVPKEDTTAIVEAINGAESANAKVRAKQARKAALAEMAAHEKERDKLTQSIEAIDAEKTAVLKSAKWPIQGLGFGKGGVTLNGLPFEQASAAQRMKTSLAIGMEQNPRLRVLLLQDASLLDVDAMAMVKEFASDNNMQVWLERVNTEDEGAIIIEDGSVKGQE